MPEQRYPRREYSIVSMRTYTIRLLGISLFGLIDSSAKVTGYSKLVYPKNIRADAFIVPLNPCKKNSPSLREEKFS